MSNKVYKVNLYHDELKEFDVICYHPLLGADLRDIILDRPIFERCKDDLCINNCGLTYTEAEEISKEEASIIRNDIINTEEKIQKYEQYLDDVEKKSVLEFQTAINEKKSYKKKQRMR